MFEINVFENAAELRGAQAVMFSAGLVAYRKCRSLL